MLPEERSSLQNEAGQRETGKSCRHWEQTLLRQSGLVPIQTPCGAVTGLGSLHSPNRVIWTHVPGRLSQGRTWGRTGLQSGCGMHSPGSST